MTKQRSLKRLVRERMERTGESYTTALRTITSRRPARREPGLVATYPGAGPGVHRESALVQRLLASAGLGLSEAMVCGLGGGIGFMYAVFEYKEVPHPLLTFVTQHHPRPWAEEVADNLGLELVSRTSTAVPAALAKLDAALAAGTPALLTVAQVGLPWHAGVDPLDAYDPYTVVVAGRDGDQYLVDDCGESLERASRDALGEAWASHKKGRLAVRTFSVPQGGPRELTAAVRSALGTTVAHMTGPVLGNAFDVNFGLSGLEKWAGELADARTKKGWRARFSDPRAFAHAMERVVDCFTTEYGAPAATRALYAEFLREAETATALALGPAAAAAAESARLWEGVVDVAATAADPEEAFTAIARLARELLAVERRLVELLAQAVDA
jgi:hypothetical protein